MECTAIPRQRPTPRISNVRPNAAATAISKRPGPASTDSKIHGAIPENDDFSSLSMNGSGALLASGSPSCLETESATALDYSTCPASEAA